MAQRGANPIHDRKPEPQALILALLDIADAASTCSCILLFDGTIARMLDWVDELVIGAKACLDQGSAPGSGEFCEYCSYVEAVSDL